MRHLPVFILILSPLLSFAEPSPKQLQLSRELMILLRTSEMFDGFQKECIKPENTSFDAKVAFKNDPGSFKGLSPQSSYWPEVIAIYDRFRVTTCSYVSPEKLTQHVTQQYARTVSEADLQAAVAFYSSPGGRRLQNAVVEVNSSASRFMTDLMNEAYEAARSQYQTDIHEVIQKYRREPR